MKYNVLVNEGFETVKEFNGLHKNVATGIAKKEATENPDKKVFITWYRKNDGQHGYLNPSGDHAITGEAW